MCGDKYSFVLICVLILAGAVYAVDPANPPATLTQTVSDGVETITLQMTLESVRGSNFEVLVQNSSGTYDTHTPADVSTYIGTVDEYPGAIAAGILKSDGDLWTKVYFDRGYTWFTLGASKYGERGDYPAYLHWPTLDNLAPGHVGTTTYLWDQAIDISWKHFDQYASNDAAIALEQVEFNVMQFKAIYLRDALVIPGLARVVIRGSQGHCPYEASAGLGNVKVEWEANHSRPGVDYDLVAMSSPAIGGGVAWVGTVGVGNSYSANGAWPGGEFDVVGRHEIGHNWGVYDNHAGNPEGHTIDSGNAFGRFSGPEVESILDQRDAKLAYLDSQGTYNTIDVPPYASLDTSRVLAGTGSVTTDVLINDHDANADSISLSSFEALSANAAAVSLSSGTGPGGRDELTYSLGNDIGMDSFYYTIIDSSGQTATGLVLIYVDLENTLKGYWNLDETGGAVAGDMSVFGNDASLHGDMTFDSGSVAGQFGNGVYFDGVDDYVNLQGLMIEGNAVTMTAWIKREGTQVNWAGIFMCRGGASAGLDMLSNNELRYEWDGTWTFSTGLYVPGNQWTFVAMVIEPGKATVYMDDGTTLKSTVNNVAHSVQTIGGGHLGDDYGYRYFKGSIDDVRIYDYSMTRAEIEAVIAGGNANSPIPFDGADDIKFRLLKWVGGAAVSGYDVYLGTDRAAVADATGESAQYQGMVSGTAFAADLLRESTDYYWRVDTVTGSETFSGAVWGFRTAETLNNVGENLLVHLTMDNADISGSRISDVSGAPVYNGTNDGAATGTAGQIGEAIRLDGSSSRVSLPAMNLNSNTVTISTWIKRDGNQADWAGLLFAREGASDAGIQFGTDNELRYMWNGGNWGWDSGLVVPDGLWTFVALVIEPGEAAIYMNYGAGTRSAVNVATHGIEEFNGISYLGWDGNTSWSDRYFKGDIDDVAIWKRALSSAEIEYICQKGREGKTFDDATPEFITDPIAVSAAIEGMEYAGSIGFEAIDPDGGAVVYDKIDGPGWLNIAPGGALTGVPDDDDVGENQFTVRATDDEGDSTQAQMNISVLNTYTGELALADFAGLAAYWLEAGCVDVPPCGGADLSDDGDVDGEDLRILAGNWLAVCMPASLHVQSIVTGTVSGTYGREKYRAAVTINDDCGIAVGGVTVIGTFTGAFTQQITGVTDSNGVAVLVSSGQVSNPSFTFCVDDVVDEDLIYDPGGNIETCGDY